jgi:hypothetical protein
MLADAVEVNGNPQDRLRLRRGCPLGNSNPDPLITRHAISAYVVDLHQRRLLFGTRIRCIAADSGHVNGHVDFVAEIDRLIKERFEPAIRWLHRVGDVIGLMQGDRRQTPQRTKGK